MKPSENSISSPSTESERKVVFPAAPLGLGHVALRRARGTSARWPARAAASRPRASGPSRGPPSRATGPKIQSSMSKKWTPMLVAIPPDFSTCALPGDVVPAPARGHVGEVDGVVPCPAGSAAMPLAQRHDGRVHPELQDVEDPPPGLPLQLGQGVQVPRVEHQRLLADRVGPDPQREADVGVVQVVRASRSTRSGSAPPPPCGAASPRTGRIARTPGSSSRRRSSGRGCPPHRAGRAPRPAGSRCPGWPAGAAGR